jgi:hypothetical protein
VAAYDNAPPHRTIRPGGWGRQRDSGADMINFRGASSEPTKADYGDDSRLDAQEPRICGRSAGDCNGPEAVKRPTLLTYRYLGPIRRRHMDRAPKRARAPNRPPVTPRSDKLGAMSWITETGQLLTAVGVGSILGSLITQFVSRSGERRALRAEICEELPTTSSAALP